MSSELLILCSGSEVGMSGCYFREGTIFAKPGEERRIFSLFKLQQRQETRRLKCYANRRASHATVPGERTVLEENVAP